MTNASAPFPARPHTGHSYVHTHTQTDTHHTHEGDRESMHVQRCTYTHSSRREGVFVIFQYCTAEPMSMHHLEAVILLYLGECASGKSNDIIRDGMTNTNTN